MEQRSDEWLSAKLCMITSTRAHQLLSSAATRRTLMATLIRETVEAKVQSFGGTESMQRGVRLEAEAATYYALSNNAELESAGFIYSDFHPMLATSPDVLANDDGGVEIKCYEAEAHIKAVLGHTETKEINQCKWHLFITRRDWWDLFFYSDEFSGALKARTERILLPIEERLSIEKTATKFISDYEAKLEEFGLVI